MGRSMEDMVAQLLQSRADVNIKDKQGDTSLHVLCNNVWLKFFSLGLIAWVGV